MKIFENRTFKSVYMAFPDPKCENFRIASRQDRPQLPNYLPFNLFRISYFFACSGTVLYSCDHAWSQIKTGGCFCFFFGGKPLKSPEKG